MTRKLKYACDGGGVHHGLVATAIEEAGMTKKYLLTEGFRRDIVLENDGFRTGAGETWTELETDDQVLIVKTFASECVTRWRFTYPALRLISYQLKSCACGRQTQPWHDL